MFFRLFLKIKGDPLNLGLRKQLLLVSGHIITLDMNFETDPTFLTRVTEGKVKSVKMLKFRKLFSNTEISDRGRIRSIRYFQILKVESFWNVFKKKFLNEKTFKFYFLDKFQRSF